MSFVDTHAHLYMKQYHDTLDTVLKEAQKAGISQIIVPSSDAKSLSAVLEISQQYPNVYGALGIHPHEAKNFNNDIKKQLEASLGEKKILAVGETGLDFHYNFSPKDVQEKVFRTHIELAEKFNKPLIVHMRNSFDRMKNILKSYKKLPPIVMHCFTGSSQEASYFIEQGFYLSFTGAITFDKTGSLSPIIKALPLNTFFLETDSPYMTPTPYRGQVNQPAYIKIIAEEIAKIKEISLEDIARITTLNATNFFHLPYDKSPKTYFLKGNTLFLNLTNRRNTKMPLHHLFRYQELIGYNLNLQQEPSVESLKEIIQKNILKIQKIVFLNVGEATLREDILKDLAKYAISMKLKTVLDTDGLANKLYQRNFAAELRGLIDEVNVSLNASNPKEYQKYHRPPFGQESFGEVLNFINECQRIIPVVKIHTVEIPGLDINLCKNNIKEAVTVVQEIRKPILWRGEI